MSAKFKYKVPCRKDKLCEIRSFVSEVLAKYNVSEVEVNKLVLAVDEVCANLMIHSHQCNPNEHLELFIRVNKDNDFIFEITDKGIGFNLAEYKEPSLQEVVRKKKKGGIGLMLVRRIMDDIQFESKRNQNTCRLFKKL
ncbi:ATP-binding protein [Roseivirga sp. BDSF3-8]|uniref:ATP-binding protein n=1 Tax=Roseivirga sp. BDSF3-8 TaxID=3241598 RepID=UPI00353261C2